MKLKEIFIVFEGLSFDEKIRLKIADTNFNFYFQTSLWCLKGFFLKCTGREWLRYLHKNLQCTELPKVKTLISGNKSFVTNEN